MSAASVSKYQGSASKEPPTRAAASRGPIAFVARIAAAIDLRLDKRKQIDDLRELTDEQLRDIGLTRRDVRQPRAGAFWNYRAPHP